MYHINISSLSAAMSLCLLLSGAAMASGEDRAEQLCKEKIHDVYGISDFRHVWGEKAGHHKYKVHGKVRVDNHKYPFNCKVKNGYVKSYTYQGPNPRYRDKDDDDSNLGAVLAVGAGLAIVAAIAASAADDSGGGKSSQLQRKKPALEDDCHDALQYRIRDEHNYTARVHMKNARIEGHDLVGDAKVKYDSEHPHHATFTCHFDSRGRLMDSSYHLY